jgi:hypothetical protein
MTTTEQNSNLKIYFNILQAFFETANFLLFLISLSGVFYYAVFFLVIPFASINLFISFAVENKSRYFSLLTLIISIVLLVIAWVPGVAQIFVISALITTASSLYILYRSFGHIVNNLFQGLFKDLNSSGKVIDVDIIDEKSTHQTKNPSPDKPNVKKLNNKEAKKESKNS